MHDIEVVAIWFSSVIAGMILTMLMPRMVSEPYGSDVTQDASDIIPVHQEVHELDSVTILIEKEA